MTKKKAGKKTIQSTARTIQSVMHIKANSLPGWVVAGSVLVMYYAHLMCGKRVFLVLELS